jgi:hypothetical protein
MANDPKDKIVEIRGMKYPRIFKELWVAGKWEQPDEKLLEAAIPWIQGPIEFIEEMQWMVSENSTTMADHADLSNMFFEYRGSKSKDKPDLPWLDIDQAIIFAVNRIHGDDLGLAMDFRTSAEDPRVVGSYWKTAPNSFEWRLINNSFYNFLEELGMLKE